MHQKYIVQDGNILLAKVQFHKQLVTNPEGVRGGGQYRLDADKMTIKFFGRSHDYGDSDFDEVSRAIAEGKVYYRNTHRDQNKIFGDYQMYIIDIYGKEHLIKKNI